MLLAVVGRVAVGRVAVGHVGRVAIGRVVVVGVFSFVVPLVCSCPLGRARAGPSSCDANRRLMGTDRLVRPKASAP